MNTQDFGDFGQFVPATPPPPVSASDDDFGDFGQLVPQQAPVGSVEISPPIHPDSEPPVAPETLEKGRMLQAGVAAEAQGKDPSLAVRAAKVHLQPITGGGTARDVLGEAAFSIGQKLSAAQQALSDPNRSVAQSAGDVGRALAGGAKGLVDTGIQSLAGLMGGAIGGLPGVPKAPGNPGFAERTRGTLESIQDVKPPLEIPQTPQSEAISGVLSAPAEASKGVGEAVFAETGSPTLATLAETLSNAAQFAVGGKAGKGKLKEPAPKPSVDAAPLADKVKAALPEEPQRTAVADAFAEALKKEPPVAAPATAAPVQTVAPVQTAPTTPVTAPAVETPTVSAPPKSPETVAATAGAPIPTAEKPRIRVQAGSQPVLEEQTGTIATPTEAPTKGAVPTVTARKIDDNPPIQPAANDAVNLETVPEPAKPAVQEAKPTAAPVAKGTVDLGVPSLSGKGDPERYAAIEGKIKTAAQNATPITLKNGDKIWIGHGTINGGAEGRAIAFDASGNARGYVDYATTGNFNPFLRVEDQYQRQGVASALYDSAVGHGAKIPDVSDTSQIRTTEGQAFREAYARNKQEPTNAPQAGKQPVDKVEQHSGDDVVGTPTQAGDRGIDGKRPPAPEPEIGPQAAAQGADEAAQLPVETKVETKLDAGGGRGNVVSGRLEDIVASRERAGLDETPKQASKPDTETKAEADALKDEIDDTASDILAKKRPSSDKETFALTDAVAESERKGKELSEAIEQEKDPIKKQSLQVEKDRNDAVHALRTAAHEVGTRESGRALRASQGERTTDLGSELHVVQRATEAKGKPLTPEEKAPLEAGARQINKLEKTAKQARKKASGTKADKIIAKAGKEKRKALQDKDYNDLIDEFLADHEKTLDKCRIG